MCLLGRARGTGKTIARVRQRQRCDRRQRRRYCAREIVRCQVESGHLGECVAEVSRNSALQQVDIHAQREQLGEYRQRRRDSAREGITVQTQRCQFRQSRPDKGGNRFGQLVGRQLKAKQVGQRRKGRGYRAKELVRCLC